MGRSEEGYFLEFISMPHAVKVTAIDPATGTEVSIVGDPKAGQERLSRLAIQKLEYVLAKAQKSDDSPNGPGVLA